MAVGVRSVPLPSESDFYTWQDRGGVPRGIRLREGHKRRAHGASIVDFSMDQYLRHEFELQRKGEDVHCGHSYCSYGEETIARELAKADILFVPEPFFLVTKTNGRRKPYIYLPDLMPELKIDGKQVAIEDKGVPKNSDGSYMVDPEIIFRKMVRKYSAFKLAYHDIHLVLFVDDVLAELLSNYSKGKFAEKIADEIHHVPDRLRNGEKSAAVREVVVDLKRRSENGAGYNPETPMLRTWALPGSAKHSSFP